MILVAQSFPSLANDRNLRKTFMGRSDNNSVSRPKVIWDIDTEYETSHESLSPPNNACGSWFLTLSFYDIILLETDLYVALILSYLE